MAKKSFGTYLLYSLPFLVGGFLVYSYVRRSKKIREKAMAGGTPNEIVNEPVLQPTKMPTATPIMKPKTSTTTATAPSTSWPSTSGISGVGRPVGDYTTKYTVTVAAGSNLNIRTDPNTTASILEKIPRGTVVLGKPSSTAGWIAVSKDGRTLYGYASKQFLSVVI